MKLLKSQLLPNKTVEIGGSKSISNRLLILQKLFGNIIIENLSTAKDTEIMSSALASNAKEINIHHAGTAMRFLTSYCAIRPGKSVVLTGSERMKQRPIGLLVDALRSLGADIQYLGAEGFPPLKITGKNINKNSVEIPADISSQFITSLLLIGGKLDRGLEVRLLGEITSRPYLEMTLRILQDIGIQTDFIDNTIRIHKRADDAKPRNKKILVESDWSSAGYWYSFCAVGREKINLKAFVKNSLQGDSRLFWIYDTFFGVQTDFLSNGEISLIPAPDFTPPEKIELNMNVCPDIAQTLCVTAAALKIPFKITGLSTLKVKETDRLLALKNELTKIGCITEITGNSIESLQYSQPEENISIKTYDDHRMAMSFAPFCLIQNLNIENEEVVEKSYPHFWKDLTQILKN